MPSAEIRYKKINKQEGRIVKMKFALGGAAGTLPIFFNNPLTAFAQTSAADPTLEERLAKAEEALSTAQTAGDNAWMLVCSALVLMMTGPGLALFYGGLVRKKNILATMMQSFILMAVVTLLWAIYRYSIAFAEGTPFFGNLSYLLLRGVGAAP